jgi:lipopolysaccharide/colanic/teichoic acid biosynthesis glycosyltransferase
MKRALDMLVAGAGLMLLSPVLAALAVAIYLQDYNSPFYVATRAGKGERPFRMVKFRSMVVRADSTGVDSTAGDDPRITRLGAFIRRFKLDEIPQLLNVMSGSMSVVGPRPNVERETRLYTADEKRLLSIRPGMTDLASIVFADESDILRGSDDPDLRYNQIIRPWKSRLGLLYADAPHRVTLDLRILWLTVVAAIDRNAALAGVQRIASSLGADDTLLGVISRSAPLLSAAPPGASEIVRSRAIVA